LQFEIPAALVAGTDKVEAVINIENDNNIALTFVLIELPFSLEGLSNRRSANPSIGQTKRFLAAARSSSYTDVEGS
jgi:hypothetical protein